MEEKRNYVIYIEDTRNFVEEKERVVLMTEQKAKTIKWFMDTFDINGCVELAENYQGEEI